MAKVEIDEQEFKAWEQTKQTLNKIRADKEALLNLERAHKKIDPNAVTKALDEYEASSKENAEWQTKFEELQKSLKEKEDKRETDASLATATARVESGRKRLRDAKYTEEGIEAVEKFMQERGIADHEVAAAYLEKQNPPQEIMSPRAFGGFNFVEPPKEGESFVKSLLDSRGEDDNAVLKAATEAIAETRGARVRR